MPQQASPLGPHDVLPILFKYRRRWFVPTVLLTLVAMVVAVVHSPSWEASQALVLREEGVGQTVRPGRFESPEAMKTAQETIMELSKSHGVLAATLKTVEGRTPTLAQIDEFRNAVSVQAPKGIEFGKSEVFYLLVKDRSRPKALQLAAALGQQLDQSLRELREQKANGLVNELNQSVELAENQLAEATRKLAELERSVGSDLAELRILNTATTGESNLRQTLIHLKNELRQATLDRQTYDELLRLLEAARNDPAQLVATPNHLLQAQPALQRLKDGLVDAQIRAAQLLGELSPVHPRVQAALAGQQQIAERLYTELVAAIGSVQAQRRIIDGRIALLESQQTELTDRMAKIAGIRPSYENLTAEVRSRAEILKQQQNDLAQAIANRQASRLTGQLTCLDEPTTNDRRSGPGRAMIVAAGLFGGLAAGFGLVFLTVPLPAVPTGARARATGPTATGVARRGEAEASAAAWPARESPAPAASTGYATGSNRIVSFKDALKSFFCVSPNWN